MTNDLLHIQKYFTFDMNSTNMRCSKILHELIIINVLHIAVIKQPALGRFRGRGYPFLGEIWLIIIGNHWSISVVGPILGVMKISGSLLTPTTLIDNIYT